MKAREKMKSTTSYGTDGAYKTTLRLSTG